MQKPKGSIVVDNDKRFNFKQNAYADCRMQWQIYDTNHTAKIFAITLKGF